MARDYKKEYADYHGKPEQIKERASRNKSVLDLGRKGKSSKDGKEVDHKDANPLNRSKSNVRVVSRATNRKKGSNPL